MGAVAANLDGRAVGTGHHGSHERASPVGGIRDAASEAVEQVPPVHGHHGARSRGLNG